MSERQQERLLIARGGQGAYVIYSERNDSYVDAETRATCTDQVDPKTWRGFPVPDDQGFYVWEGEVGQYPSEQDPDEPPYPEFFGEIRPARSEDIEPFLGHRTADSPWRKGGTPEEEIAMLRRALLLAVARTSPLPDYASSAEKASEYFIARARCGDGVEVAT